MTDMELRLLKDELAYESLVDMRSAQPAKDRLHYFDTVLEGSAEKNAILLQKLYSDIISKSNVDFGTIPQSRGNIIKYKEYTVMEQSIESINELFKGIACDDVRMMNELHDMIISSRKDFELGYTLDIEIIKVIYCTCVMSLYEMINVCLLDYTKMLKKGAKGEDFDFSNIKKKDLIVIKNVDSLLKSYKNGQWKKMMTAFIKDSNTKVATEAVPGGLTITAKFAGGKGVGAAAASIWNAIPIGLKWTALVIAAVIGIFFAIRGLIYLFYSGSVSVMNYAKTNKELLDIMIEKEKLAGDVDPKIIAKHEKLAGKLESLGSFIEVKILNNDKAAKKDLEKSNKENYSVDSFNNSSFAFGGDATF